MASGSGSTPINIPSAASSIDSFKLADGSPVGFATAGGGKNVNFLSQLENMMVAVKKEASSLESMKLKLKDMEELKNKLHDAKSRLAAAESENQQLRRTVKESDDKNVEMRNDMQRLNDIYYAERAKLSEAQQFCSRLEQEISGIKQEKDFFSKEASKVPGLKSALKTAKAQLDASKKSADDEKTQVESRMADLVKKCTTLEKANEDCSRHLSSLTENLNAAEQKISDLEVSVATEAEKLTREKNLRNLVHDRLFMSNEDLRLQVARLPAAVLSHETRTDALKSEIQKLKLLATGKTNELMLVTAESKKMQEKLEHGAQAYTTQISTLQDTLRELNTKSNEIMKSNAAYKGKLQSKSTECEAVSKDLADVKALYKQLQLSAQQREAENTQAIKGLNLQSEDYSFKLQSVQAQLETVQQQNKGEQGKYWEEVKKLKDSESLLLEECDRLNQELQEKTLQLHTLQASSSTTESTLRSECSSASSMVSSLKEELEKRLNEMVALRDERDGLLSDKEELTANIDNLKADLSKNDGVFKRTLEADRGKMKQELLNRTQRIRALESEKQELLSETEQLVSQVTDTRNEINALQTRFNDLAAARDTLSEQYDVVKSHNTQLLSDIQSGDWKQDELRATVERNNVLHTENTERLEMLLRESKKSASLQVLEMSQHIKSISSDLDSLTLEHDKAQDNEKRALLDLDRAKNDLHNATLQHQETLQQVNNDNNTLRRELQEVRSRHKITSESKTRVEMELVNVRNECGRFEMELHKQNIVVKEQESSVASLQESVAVLQQQLGGANEGAQRLKNVINELEDGVQRKNATIEGLKEELVQLERDGLLEIRRLRVQLNSAENEISELRPMIPLLQKEASEAKSTLSSVKNNQSGAVNKLLDEVRRAEESLAKERKKAAAEVEGCHSRIVELQAQLEKTRELLEESTAKAKTDRSERDLRLMQLEGEAERAKAAAASKEARIEELVQQHHADRVKMHELSDRASGAEAEMASLKSSLSHEQAARQRLDARLRSLMSTPDYAAESGGGGFLSARGHSSGMGGGGSSLLHSTKASAYGSGGVGGAAGGSGSGSGVTNSMHRAGSSDQWEEDVYDDHSNANTVHTNHSAHTSHTMHTSTTMPYNRFDDAINTTNNSSHTMRAQSPFNPSRYNNNNNNTNNNTDDYSSIHNTMRGSRADLGLYNNGSNSDSSRSPPPSNLMSPSREQYSSSTRHAQSPVVDRVGAALAARAALSEASKNGSTLGSSGSTSGSTHAMSALKLAQQQRAGMSGSASRHSGAVGSVSGVNGGTSSAMSGSSSVGALTLNIPAMNNSHSSGSILYTSNNTTDAPANNTNTRRPPSGNNNSNNNNYNDRDFADRDYATSILHTINDTTNANTNNTTNTSDSSVEESIRRTQAMLDRRAAGGAGSGGAATGADGSRARTPNSGRAQKLSDTIQQASALYPPSPVHRSDEDSSYHDSSSYIDTPALRPISPPHLHSTATTAGSSANANQGGAYNNASSAYSNLGRDLDDEVSDESDTDHTSSVAPYGNYSNNPNITEIAGTSAGKKKKSVKKNAKKSTADGKYDGLQDALQLPKIGGNSNIKRK